MQLTLFMVISSGEEALAIDSLARARAWIPSGWPMPSLLIADNTEAGFVLPKEAEPHWQMVRLYRVPQAPRPYFQIARSVAMALSEAAQFNGDLLIKIDPDTVICSGSFFTSLADALTSEDAVFYSWFVRYRGWGNNAKRLLRLVHDALPIGFSRTAGKNRYGKSLRLRLRPAWHWRQTLKALVLGRLPRAQPSGGGYAIRLTWLRSKNFRQWARQARNARSPDGLEWNDDTLLPIVIRASGGRLVDLRQRPNAELWRWLHGSRYFDLSDLKNAHVAAVHPLKDNPKDRAIRNGLPLRTE